MGIECKSLLGKRDIERVSREEGNLHFFRHSTVLSLFYSRPPGMTFSDSDPFARSVYKALQLSPFIGRFLFVNEAMSLFSDASGRRYLRIRWEGEVEVPLDKSDFGTKNPGAKWWGEMGNREIMIAMQSRLSNTIQFRFSNIGKGSQIKVWFTVSVYDVSTYA